MIAKSLKGQEEKDTPCSLKNNFGNTKRNVLLMMPVNKPYCLKGKSISDGSALDPMGLKLIDTLWSLHNILFFFASTLHLDEISKFLDYFP